MRLRKIAVFLPVLLLLSGCVSGEYSRVKNLDTATGKTVVCFGNSLTAGNGAPAGSDYPSILSERLSLPVVNAGVPGDTAAAAISRIKEDVLSEDPKIVIVELGANDFLKTGGERKAIDDAFHELEVIIDEIQNYGAVVVLAGFSVNYEIEQRYKRLARKKGVVLIPNIMKGITGNSSLMADSLHPNARGYEVMAESVLEVLELLLEEMQ
jgi:acyl-CoA thioesterase-1